MPLFFDSRITAGYGRTTSGRSRSLVLSTQRERDAASKQVDRLVDAGLSYPGACAVVRGLRLSALPPVSPRRSLKHPELVAGAVGDLG